MRVALTIILVPVVSGFLTTVALAEVVSRITIMQTDRDAVLKVVQAFFDTMTAKDVDGAREILVPQGRFHAMRAGAEPRSLSNEEYLAQLQASKQTMRERIWNPEVRVHGSIATMWAPYDFWIDGKFSHCGIDAFDLIKTSKGWQIAGGIYTLESKCQPSPLGPLKQ
jgi:hypothetical protein